MTKIDNPLWPAKNITIKNIIEILQKLPDEGILKISLAIEAVSYMPLIQIDLPLQIMGAVVNIQEIAKVAEDIENDE